MSSEHVNQVKPVISVGIMILTLFTVVFFQMEERRLGYSLLKISKNSRKSAEDKKNLEVQLAKLTRPQFVEQMAATRLTLKKAQSHQIIILPSLFLNVDKGDLFE
jgi:cell division protein FtsL